MTIRNLRRRTVEWGEIRLLVREATYGDAIRRSAIIASALKALEGQEEEPGTGLTMMVVMDYASCLSATESAEGLDLEALRQNMEAFLELPEGLVEVWRQAVYELNPRWDPKEIFGSLTEPSGISSNA